MIDRLQKIIEENFQNEQLSVEDLASMMNMSRSQLHRKLKQTTGQSANQLIREYRLQRAMELLSTGNLTVAEVAFQVGFGSASYFTTCFADQYGYPPGEVKHRIQETPPEVSEETEPIKVPWLSKQKLGILVSFILLFVSVSVWYIYENRSSEIRGFDLGKSIAVLPFKNLNESKENEYFSEGVAEAINRHLSQVEDIKIISLTSTDRYRDSDKSAFEIGGELKVSNLLEGSIQRYGNTVRIEIRLIDAYSERQVWAKNYDRELKDIFKTQTEIAEQVAGALKYSLSVEEKILMNKESTTSVEAYDLYLKGVYEYRTFTRAGLHNAIDYFEQAISIDPNYALAYSGQAGSYILLASIFGAELNPLDAMGKAAPLLEKALLLDPSLPEAHMWNALCLLFKDWDFEGAEAENKKAIVTNKRDALYIYADFLNFTRRHEEALVMHKKMYELDPYHPNNLMILSLFYLGRFEEAQEVAESRIRLFNNYSTLDSYGFLLLNTGKYQQAIEVFQEVIDIEGIRYPRMLGWSGAAYARSGQKEKALALIEELKEKRKRTDAGSLAFFIAVIYSALDDKPAAIHWLQESVAQHEMEVPWLISEPQFYLLHKEPAFQALVEKVGFPQ